MSINQEEFLKLVKQKKLKIQILLHKSEGYSDLSGSITERFKCEETLVWANIEIYNSNFDYNSVLEGLEFLCNDIVCLCEGYYRRLFNSKHLVDAINNGMFKIEILD